MTNSTGRVLLKDDQPNMPGVEKRSSKDQIVNIAEKINQFQGKDNRIWFTQRKTIEVLQDNYANGNQIKVLDLQGPIINHKPGDTKHEHLNQKNEFAKGTDHQLDSTEYGTQRLYWGWWNILGESHQPSWGEMTNCWGKRVTKPISWGRPIMLRTSRLNCSQTAIDIPFWNWLSLKWLFLLF